MENQNKTIRVTETDAKNILEFIAELQNDWHPAINFANAKIRCVEDDYNDRTLFIFDSDTLQINAVHFEN